jgi:hypothetical protein
MVRYYYLIFFIFVLTGCGATSPISKDSSSLYKYTNSTVGYSIELPEQSLVVWNGKQPTDSKNTGFGTYPMLSTPGKDDYKIKIRTSNLSCTPELHGIFDTPLNTLTNGDNKINWGKVNFFEKFGHMGERVDYEPEWPVCPEQIDATESHIYALCSEKDGKTIVICISQMTDNPGLAKQIFETFRWTE